MHLERIWEHIQRNLSNVPPKKKKKKKIKTLDLSQTISIALLQNLQLFSVILTPDNP